MKRYLSAMCTLIFLMALLNLAVMGRNSLKNMQDDEGDMSVVANELQIGRAHV